MKPWPQVLREHDPIDPLSADETAAIRRAVMVEARSAAAAMAAPPRLVPVLALGSALMVAVLTGVFVAKAHPEVASHAPAPASGEVRQLQFATPGGTRIIWQFNPDFSLRETNP